MATVLEEVRQRLAALTDDHRDTLRREDTTASVQAAHRAACERSRTAAADLPLDAVVTGPSVRPPPALRRTAGPAPRPAGGRVTCPGAGHG